MWQAEIITVFTGTGTENDANRPKLADDHKLKKWEDVTGRPSVRELSTEQFQLDTQLSALLVIPEQADIFEVHQLLGGVRMPLVSPSLYSIAEQVITFTEESGAIPGLEFEIVYRVRNIPPKPNLYIILVECEVGVLEAIEKDNDYFIVWCDEIVEGF